jgi:hypothetical protein
LLTQLSKDGEASRAPVSQFLEKIVEGGIFSEDWQQHTLRMAASAHCVADAPANSCEDS